MIADSKDTIRSRMIRTASGLWGFTDAQDVNSFDPVVGMILGGPLQKNCMLSIPK